MEVIKKGSTLFNFTEKAEQDIYIAQSKLPDFVFKTMFDNYFFIQSDLLLGGKDVYDKATNKLVKASKGAILTSLDPPSDGSIMFKFKMEEKDFDNDYITALNYGKENEPHTKPLIFYANSIGFYALDKSWAFFADPWGLEIAVLGVNSVLRNDVDRYYFRHKSEIEELFFFMDNISTKEKFTKAIQNSYPS
jgi:hypothetical protein